MDRVLRYLIDRYSFQLENVAIQLVKMYHLQNLLHRDIPYISSKLKFKRLLVNNRIKFQDASLTNSKRNVFAKREISEQATRRPDDTLNGTFKWAGVRKLADIATI